MMTQEPPLKLGCASCGVTSDLYGSSCRHMTICRPCGKRMVENATPCPDCGVVLTRLIREFHVKAHPLNKPHFVGRFLQGVPSFVKKKSNDVKWNMQREGLQGRQLTEALREKYKAKPWLLSDDQGQSYQGSLEGGQQASYYLLMMHGKDFLAMPAGAWYNFHKATNYKQLTLEEAEEQMKNRRRTADGYQRWLMKAANTGAAAFGEVEKISGGGGGGRGGFKRRADDDDDDPAFSDKGEEDADDEEDRKNRLGMNKKGGDEDGEEPARGDDREFEDEEPEKGDDWEHEETFTDDDETVGNDPEEREEAPEIAAPPEIKQEEEDEEAEQEDGQQEKGGLSESGLELKKLLGKSAGLDESGDEESSDDDNDLDNEDNSSPVLAPKRKEAPKEEPVESTPAKAANAAPGRTTPANTAGSKGKRKAGTDDSKSSPATSSKKVKTESSQEDVKLAKEPPPAAASANTKAAASPVKGNGAPPKAKASSQVTEEDVKAVLKQAGPIKSHDLVNKFKSRLATKEDKQAFASVLKNISRIHKTDAGNFIVLREKI